MPFSIMMLGFLKDMFSLGYYAALRFLNTNRRGTVLVYHSVGHIGRNIDPYKINIEPRLFKKQIEFLSAFNKRDLTLTFDDGFASIFDVVFPLAIKYNIKVILFITVGFIDGGISFNNLFRNNFNIGPLTWWQIKEMSACGLQIGSHTLTHPNLTKLDNEAAYAQISDSKKKLEDKIGKNIKYFAYPYGSRNTFDNRIKGIVRDAGYERAYTNIMGFNSEETDPYELKRIRIYSDDNMFRFKLKVNGGYNWVDTFAKRRE